MRRLLALLLLCLAASAAQAQRSEPVDMRLVLAQEAAPTLAAYRLFADAGARQPNVGLTPYALNTELYSDGALKFRYVFLPPGTHARYSAGDVFDFPVGTVLVKTFAVAADIRRPTENVRFLETRLLIHQQSGWAARAYVWNEAQTEARLAIAGADVPANWIDRDGSAVALTWRVPNRNQCGGCHASNGTVRPLGPSARNLNRDLAYDGGALNQLSYWAARGLLEGVQPTPVPRAPDAFDAASGSLDARARAYLDVNCAHCHNPLGPAHTSGLDLRSAQETPAAWGVNKRPVAAGRGSADMEFSIAQGHPERSILVYRMESLDPGIMMPELGRQRIDAQGVALIREWIAAMDQRN